MGCVRVQPVQVPGREESGIPSAPRQAAVLDFFGRVPVRRFRAD